MHKPCRPIYFHTPNRQRKRSQIRIPDREQDILPQDEGYLVGLVTLGFIGDEAVIGLDAIRVLIISRTAFDLRGFLWRKEFHIEMRFHLTLLRRSRRLQIHPYHPAGFRRFQIRRPLLPFDLARCVDVE